MAKRTRWHIGFDDGVLVALLVLHRYNGMVTEEYKDIVRGCGGHELLKHAKHIDDSQVPHIEEALGISPVPSERDPGGEG